MSSNPETYIRDALQQLGGDRKMVTGASLGGKAFELAAADDFNLREYIRSEGLSFGRYLMKIEDDLKLKIIRQEKKDWLVGFHGAELIRPHRENIDFRADLYRAFTAFSGGYVYDRAEDRFLPGEPTDTMTQVNSVTRPEAFDIRREFAETLGADRDAVAESLGGTAPTIADFSKCVRDIHATDQWRSFFTNWLKARVVEWAAEHDIELKTDWFQRSPSAISRWASSVSSLPHLAITRRGSGKSGVLSVLAELSEEDLDKITVPLSVLAKLLSKRKP
jgi:hypothetical protein